MANEKLKIIFKTQK